MKKKVSVVIPTYNEKNYISNCLTSVLSQKGNFDLEILVCDGKSTDSTKEIVQQFAQENAQVNYLLNEKQFTPFALNLGAKNATGDVIIILGGHAELCESFIENNLNCLYNNANHGCVGGVIENVYENRFSKLLGLAMSSPFGMGNARFRTGGKPGLVDTVAFGAYRKEVFNEEGYFNETLVRNQDDEFNFRIQKSGKWTIFFDPTIRSKYYVRSDAKKLRKQYFQYGYWKVYVNKIHKTITTLRQMIPFLLVLWTFGGLFIGIFSNLFLKVWACGLLFYLFSALISAVKAKTKDEQPGDVFKLVQLFILLHYSYGLGYGLGLFRFIIFGKDPSKKSQEVSR